MALAAVGWYLMMPPWGKLNAPLSEWVVYQSFDSAEVCTVARKSLVDYQGNYKGMAMTLVTQSGGNLQFDGSVATPEVSHAIAQADAALVSIPQTQSGDPVLTAFGEALTEAKQLHTVVYLSTVGVYGDHAGAWVDEQTPPRPDMARSRERLSAERAWQDFGARNGLAVAVLRLAGIYGPNRNALVQVARGDARRIVKPGQVFNRIHVDDIAQAIDAALEQRASGIFNVADDEPCPPGRRTRCHRPHPPYRLVPAPTTEARNR